MSHLTLVHDRKPDPNTPDLPGRLTEVSVYTLRARDSFRVGSRVFRKIDQEDDTYSDGKITVYHDQQDSTSWAARVGHDLRTGYFWAPEHAVEKILRSLKSLEGVL